MAANNHITDIYEALLARSADMKLTNGKARSEKVQTRMAQDVLFFEEFEARLGRTLKKFTLPNKKLAAKKPVSSKKQVANLLLSDLHFGSMLGQEVLFPYGALEESRRMASVVDQTIENFSDKADAINVYILGDVIQNQLHDARDGAPLAAQTCAAIHLLGQTLQQLSSHFSQVEVFFATGNHGRFTSRHKERATHQKWDSLESVVYFSLMKTLAGVKSVRFNLNKSHYINHMSAGHHMFATHGDTIMSVGSPNKSVNVKNIETLLGRISGNFEKPVKVFMCGHTHAPLMHMMSNGTYLIMNGALVPSDEFASTHGWLKTTCGQWGWITNEKSPVRDIQFMSVGQDQDKDSDLNRIITPYEY